MNDIKPLYLLAGGSFTNPKGMVPYLSRALKECGDSPKVAYIGTASNDNPIFFRMVKALLKQAGAGKVELARLAKDNADINTAKSILKEADAIFISGGEVDDGMSGLEKHGMTTFLRELRSRGKLFFGISAGSIMMGMHWVRWDDPENDATAKLFDCLCFAGTTFDTHAEDEGWKELKTALRLQGPGAKGYGIPRDSMVAVDVRGNMEVSGSSLVCYENKEGRIVPGTFAGQAK